MRLLDIPLRKDEAWYKLDGTAVYDADIRTARKENLLPRVTNILSMWPKPMLVNWQIEQGILAALTLPREKGEDEESFAKRVVADAQRQVKDTAEWGTKFHAIIERIMACQAPGAMGDYQPFVYKWSEWFKAAVHEVVALEKVVVSEAFGFAGRLDHLWIVDGEITLADTKTRGVKKGKVQWYDEQAIQLAAYTRCLPTMELPAPTRWMSVVINRDLPEAPYVKTWTQAEIEEGWLRFRACFDLWKLYKSYSPISQ